MEEREIRMYICEHCGKKFDDPEECRAHESSHVETFEDATPERLANALEDIAIRGESWHMGETVLGIPAQTFKNAMKEAARRLRKDQKEG